MGGEADRREIVGLAEAYCRMVDAADFDSLAEVFTSDATTELGARGQVGIAEISDRLSEALGKFVSWEHSIEPVTVEIEGDSAVASYSVTAVHVRPPGESPPTDTVVGTYEDRLVRTEAGWRISHRALVVTDRY